ncbi:hypothetical protein [Enterococcus termitis]|uniref:hypothetical protein n=1 Tax=Enterococcus termitis TaxID=332950 RepID=UPI001112E4BC|nr:hypothetical protein [Enterococcus termitis]
MRNKRERITELAYTLSVHNKRRKKGIVMDQKYVPAVISLIFLFVAATILIKPLPIKVLMAIITVVSSGYFYHSCLSIVSSKK